MGKLPLLDLHLLGIPANIRYQTGVTEVEDMPLESLDFEANLTADQTALPVSFEDFGKSLSELPRAYFEPDGSFLWAGEEDGGWRVDGMVYDDGQHVLWCEIKGQLPFDSWQQILELAGRKESLMVLLLPQQELVAASQIAKLWAD